LLSGGKSDRRKQRQNAVAIGGKQRGKMERQCGLADTAFLIGHDNSHGSP
jgi:hypothetical protein